MFEFLMSYFTVSLLFSFLGKLCIFVVVVKIFKKKTNEALAKYGYVFIPKSFLKRIGVSLILYIILGLPYVGVVFLILCFLTLFIPLNPEYFDEHPNHYKKIRE